MASCNSFNSCASGSKDDQIPAPPDMLVSGTVHYHITCSGPGGQPANGDIYVTAWHPLACAWGACLRKYALTNYANKLIN